MKGEQIQSSTHRQTKNNNLRLRKPSKAYSGFFGEPCGRYWLIFPYMLQSVHTSLYNATAIEDRAEKWLFSSSSAPVKSSSGHELCAKNKWPLPFDLVGLPGTYTSVYIIFFVLSLSRAGWNTVTLLLCVLESGVEAGLSWLVSRGDCGRNTRCRVGRQTSTAYGCETDA